MEVTVWLALIGLFFAGGLTPGPAVMLVMASSLRYGPKPALLPALGISFANLIWISAAMAGAGALALRFPSIFFGLKLTGLGFILYLAWRMIASDPTHTRVDAKDAPPRPALFLKGVGLQLANPNALVFFGLILPAYIDAARPLWTQALIIMATVTATEMFGLAVYAWAADAMNQRFAHPQFTRRFNQLAALAMVATASIAVIMTSLSN